MTHKILILPNIEKRTQLDKDGNIIDDGNELKIFDMIDKDAMFKIEKGYRNQVKTKATRCQLNGVFEEDVLTGQPALIQGESVTFEIHPDCKITQDDIDMLPVDTSFGNGISTFSINGKKCTIIVLQLNATIDLNTVPQKLLNDMKSKDKIP